MLPDTTRLRMETTTAANSTHLGQYGCRQTRSLGAYPGATPTQRNPGLAGLFESRMRFYALWSLSGTPGEIPHGLHRPRFVERSEVDLGCVDPGVVHQHAPNPALSRFLLLAPGLARARRSLRLRRLFFADQLAPVVRLAVARLGLGLPGGRTNRAAPAQAVRLRPGAGRLERESECKTHAECECRPGLRQVADQALQADVVGPAAHMAAEPVVARFTGGDYPAARDESRQEAEQEDVA